MKKPTSGGSAEIDVRLDTTMPETASPVPVVITLIPAGWLSNLANLARPASELGGPENALAWYPLSNILAHLAVMVTLGMIALTIWFFFYADSSLIG